MNQTETVAVVMCTYNGASRHLAEQLDSLFAQTLMPKEIIVQDDCSTDNTMELLADYARRAPDGVQMRENMVYIFRVDATSIVLYHNLNT